MLSFAKTRGAKALLFAAGLVVCMCTFAFTTLAFSPTPDTGYADGTIVRSVSVSSGSCDLSLATSEGPLVLEGLLADECVGLEAGDDITESLLGEER